MKTKRNSLILAVAVLTAVLVVLPAGAALAHGGAEVVVTPDRAAPGETITLTGEGFEAGSQVAITLEGVKGVFAVTTLAVDPNGDFQGTAQLPDVGEGSYQLKAVGGDDTAEATFTVLAAAPPASSSQQPAATAGPAEGQAEGTTASQPMAAPPAEGASEPVVYARSTADTVVAGIILALVVAVGAVALLRTGRHTTVHGQG